VHSHCGQLHPGPSFVLGRIDHRHLANPGSAQNKSNGAAALPAADDHDILVDARPVRDPILRVGPNQPQCVAASISRSIIRSLIKLELFEKVAQSIINSRTQKSLLTLGEVRK
jgi:hypothetical protein